MSSNIKKLHFSAFLRIKFLKIVEKAENLKIKLEFGMICIDSGIQISNVIKVQFTYDSKKNLDQ